MSEQRTAVVDIRKRFEDYLPVDVEKLRPNQAYGRMVEIRRERMRAYLDGAGRLRPELVEEVPCPVCAGGKFVVLFHKEGFQFVRCADCTLVYVNPALKDEHVRQVYKHQSYSDLTKALMEPSDAYRRERFGTERVAIVDGFLRPDGRRGLRLLDVGCATGFFVQAAKDAGWDAAGVESNPFQADFARNAGLDVRNETIEETSFPEGSFDAVTLFEVIEHVKQPMVILEKAYRLLRPGGMLFLYTPNFDCASRLIMGLDSHFIWGSNHLTYFTVPTLAAALDRAGFRVEHSETQGLDIEDMIWYFEEAGRHDMAFARSFRHQLQFLINGSGWGKNIRMYARRV
jgi:2-polyprenyl-3-methyl-5-hydroxy-6-metoxy-1,4-benzoquinol methylase